MKMHKVTMYVVDIQGFGLGDFMVNVEQENDGYIIHPHDVKTTDIGEWSDDHPTNKKNITKEELERYFE